jgi:hypothetical protein
VASGNVATVPKLQVYSLGTVVCTQIDGRELHSIYCSDDESKRIVLDASICAYHRCEVGVGKAV